MLLTFNKENIEKRNFISKIINGIKVHTIRKDESDRWLSGKSIQFYALNPRNGGKKFADGVVTMVWGISIVTNLNTVVLYPFEYEQIKAGKDLPFIPFCPPITLTTTNELDNLAINDGFDNWEEMKTFFPNFFRGKLIFWRLKDEGSSN